MVRESRETEIDESRDGDLFQCISMQRDEDSKTISRLSPRLDTFYPTSFKPITRECTLTREHVKRREHSLQLTHSLISSLFSQSQEIRDAATGKIRERVKDLSDRQKKMEALLTT